MEIHNSQSASSARPAENSLAGRVAPFWPWLLTVVGLSAGLLFIGLGAPNLWGPEGRWGSIVREMRLSGNYFWPTINGSVYFDKPLLSYWLIAAASQLTGNLDEFSIRLPGALAGLLGVALLMVLARRLYGSHTAIFAGFIMATCCGYVFWTRVASADVDTVTGVLAALTLYRLHAGRKAGAWIIGLWLIMAVSSLTKGLLGFALPLLIIGIDALLSDGWRELGNGVLRGPLAKRITWLVARQRWLVNWYTLAALALAGTIYWIPFALSQGMTHSHAGLDAVFRENIVRFFEPFDHREPFYRYTYAIFPMIAPWSVFLPAVLALMLAGAKDKSDRFALTYFWVTLIFFTLSGSRRDYYLLPIVPAAALLTARLFSIPKKALDGHIEKLIAAGFAILAIAVFALGLLVLLPLPLRPGVLDSLPNLPHRALFALIWAVQIAAIVLGFIKFSSRNIGRSVCVIAYLGLFYSFVVINPLAEMDHGEKAFAQSVRRQLNGETSQLVLFKVGGPGLVFYLAAKKPIPVYWEGRDLSTRAEGQGELWVILLAKDLPSLPLHGSVVEREIGLSLGAELQNARGLVLFHAQSRANIN